MTTLHRLLQRSVSDKARDIGCSLLSSANYVVLGKLRSCDRLGDCNKVCLQNVGGYTCFLENVHCDYEERDAKVVFRCLL